MIIERLRLLSKRMSDINTIEDINITVQGEHEREVWLPFQEKIENIEIDRLSGCVVGSNGSIK